MRAKKTINFFLLMAIVLLWACKEYPAPTPEPDPEPQDEPILEVSVPGAYGAEGGNQCLQEGMQTSLLTYDGGAAWRMIQPSGCKVVSFSALPLQMKAGDSISFLYRVSEQGITRVCRKYEDVKVLQVKDGLVWLKKDDTTYFLVEW